jgi:peptide/nickel transport system permease protein
MGYIISNIAVASLLAGAAYTYLAARRSRMWSEAIRELWRRRASAIVVLGVFIVIGILDSVSWISVPANSSGVGDQVAISKPRSIIDRLFQPETFRESSYSAPLAARGFYDKKPLAHPGTHILGTDILGEDVLYRTLKGVRVALLIGGLTSLIVIPIALTFGVSAGYFGGRIDDAVFFVMTVLASVPSLLLLIALIMVLGVGTVQVCVALGVTSWVSFCRITRGETFKVREADYIQAARALGVSDRRIILRHVLPNLIHLVIITFALLFTGMVLSETILSYLGVGVQGSWGQMIDRARDELSRTPIIWWNIAGASIALFTLVLCVNLIADAIRDITDPRTRREQT